MTDGFDSAHQNWIRLRSPELCRLVAGASVFFVFRPEDNELEDDTHNAIKSLGVNTNCFVEVGLAGVEAKIAALSMYRGVMYFDFAQHRLFISSFSFG